MSKKGKEPTAQRFGGEFGPYRKEGTTGVSLGTFKTLVWTSNIGGLVLCVIALELLFVQQEFMWGLISLIAGVLIALFPSNYEIVGMEAIQEGLEKDSGKQKREAVDESENQQQWWNESEENLKDSNQ